LYRLTRAEVAKWSEWHPLACFGGGRPIGNDSNVALFEHHCGHVWHKYGFKIRRPAQISTR
jgi:hypothetical protein